jgi:hypothetical protein
MPQADTGAQSGIGQLGQTTGNANNLYNSGAATQMGSNLTTSAQQPLNYQGQALAAGFDPQNQLYAQQYQQNQDQTNANLANSGVANTPYGAGLANQSGQNFNINWQNQQLGREAQAANTAGQLGQTAASQATAGTQLGQSVPAFSTAEQQQTIQDLLAYLQGGTGATQAGTGQYAAEANAALGQQAVNNQALGGLGSLAGNLFGTAVKGGLFGL